MLKTEFSYQCEQRKPVNRPNLAACRLCSPDDRRTSTPYIRTTLLHRAKRQVDLSVFLAREAYAIFPRYNVLNAILLDVETLDSDNLPTFHELQELLGIAGATASTGFSYTESNAIARRSEREERQLFADALRNAVQNGIPEQRPLFYRRTLKVAEADELRTRLRNVWGITGSYWYPIDAKTHPSLVALELENIDETALQNRIKGFFKDNAIQRIWELREFDRENYRIEAGVNDLFYGTGGEGYWTSDEDDWIVYCSHEGTMTLGGSITSIASHPQGTNEPII